MSLKKKVKRTFGATRFKTEALSGAGKKKKAYIAKKNERYDRHDHYYRRAKEEGYVARSVYKLIEINEQFSLIKAKDAVLDLGVAPGSWMQYVCRLLKPEKGGCAIGIDLLDVHTAFPDWVRIVQGDIYEVNALELLPENRKKFNVILSDMAPNTTGVHVLDQDRSMGLCIRALELVDLFLATKGNFCIKVLEGGQMPQFLKTCRLKFEEVRIRRPKGTRAGSTETYVVCLRKKPPVDVQTE